MKTRNLLLPLALALAMVMTGAASADEPIWLTGAHNRAGQDLSGEWAYSVDPYRDGQYNFHGEPAKGSALRYLDIHVSEAMVKNPKTFYEFDFDIAPTMSLPGSWNSALPELRYYDGLMHYQRRFNYEPKAGTRAFLHFGAVNYKASVYVNGQKVGQHEGGFTPFSFEVTTTLRAGDNQITLEVDSQHTAQTIPPPVTDWDIYGGVTRPIKLIITPETYIDDAFVHLGTDGLIHVAAKLNGPACADQNVAFTVKALNLKSSAVSDKTCAVALKLKAPRSLSRWSPESPTLYDVELATGSDRFTDRVGFRTIEVKGDDILLNGKPIFLRGISMHEEELGSNPSRNMTEDQACALLSVIKNDMNGNYVRLSHYPHSDVMVRMADEMGLLVWSEIPVYWRIDFGNPVVLDLAKQMMTENVMRDRNRASVIIWSIGNETPQGPERLAYMSALADFTRALDTTRLISAAVLATRKDSADGVDITIDDPLLGRLDIASVNTYNGWYSGDDLERLPEFRWHRVETKPLIFSEFGADAKIGIFGDASNMKYSEDYQALYYEKTLEMADKIDWLRGLSPWILKDFRSPRRQHPTYQQGWNRKGLISETGAKKKAFHVLSDYYKTRTERAEP